MGYSGDYEINDGLGFSLDARLSHQYICLRASRNGAAEALDQHNRGRASARFMLNWGRTIQLYLYCDALAYTEAKQKWNYRLLPTLGMNLRPTQWWRLQGSFRLEGSPASIGQLNPFGYAVSRYIWQQGNPSLVAPWGQRYLLSNQFCWNTFRLTLQVQYGRYRNEIGWHMMRTATTTYYVGMRISRFPSTSASTWVCGSRSGTICYLSSLPRGLATTPGSLATANRMATGCQAWGCARNSHGTIGLWTLCSSMGVLMGFKGRFGNTPAFRVPQSSHTGTGISGLQ